MKTLILSLFAASLAVSNLNANCGACATDKEGGCTHKNQQHASCHESTLSNYFAIQKALASDDLAAAKEKALSPADEMAKSECALDGSDCCAEVGESFDAIAEATDIAAARTAFQSLSNALIAQLESHGSETIAYKMHCPMAFDGKGADWLQDSKDLRNPYYGAMMLTCGSQQAVYGKKDAKPLPHEEGEEHKQGHDHHDH